MGGGGRAGARRRRGVRPARGCDAGGRRPPACGGRMPPALASAGIRAGAGACCARPRASPRAQPCRPHTGLGAHLIVLARTAACAWGRERMARARAAQEWG